MAGLMTKAPVIAVEVDKKRNRAPARKNAARGRPGSMAQAVRPVFASGSIR
jgi:hypothetical protein